MAKPSTMMAMGAALLLVLTTGAAEAFHPFDLPSGYRAPKHLKDRASPRRGQTESEPATAPAWSPWWAEEEPDRPKAQKFPPLLEGGPRPAIAPSAPPVVAFPNSYGNGTVIIDTAGKSLYYVLSSSSAYKYPISVGRVGFTWTGTEKISRVAAWPDWRPPQEMKERQPGLPDVMTGGIRNPLGAKALYLGNSLYRIHGTNDAKTIGQAASSGCFRMLNAHVVHLAGLAGVGTTVKVLSKLPSGIASAAAGGGKS